MKFRDSNDIKTHLEFFGYKVEFIPEKDFDFLSATNTNGENFMLQIKEDFTLIFSRYSGLNPQVLVNYDFYTALNMINKSSFITKWYYDGQDQLLVIEASYNGYDKESFGNFIETYNKEINFYFETNLREFINEAA